MWQARQALVTSGPEAKGPCSSLNLVWSAVEVSFTAGASAKADGIASANISAAARNTLYTFIGYPPGSCVQDATLTYTNELI
ncbi:hypothetical protein MTBUT4_250031 [Magnetospirillum sp. UT-4]|nr:hypothetical protein MTBUT4_250031 [Magnetospirillum sp. UT-4]